MKLLEWTYTTTHGKTGKVKTSLYATKEIAHKKAYGILTK